jgi:hypothetical protein
MQMDDKCEVDQRVSLSFTASYYHSPSSTSITGAILTMTATPINVCQLSSYRYSLFSQRPYHL